MTEGVRSNISAISQEGTRIPNVTAYTIWLNVSLESSTIYVFSFCIQTAYWMAGPLLILLEL